MAAMASVCCLAGWGVIGSAIRDVEMPVARFSAGLPTLSLPRFRARRFFSEKRLNSSHKLQRSLKIRVQEPNHDGGGELEESFKPGVKPSLPSVPYGLITGLASVGFVETAYLTWAKISGGPVTCPVGSGCNDVLDSSYAYVFGVPLALVGLVAYGSVAFLSGNRLIARSSSETLGEEENWARWLLLGATTAMAVSSAYFMYILTTKLGGASCAFCIGSAVLSFSLLLSTLPVRGPSFGSSSPVNWKRMQLAVGAAVVVGLSVAFGDANSAFARQGDIDLPPVEPVVITVSTDKEITLAKYLQSIGAKMYGAFWCSHCYEQKQMFGREAMKYVDYVECYPEGYRKGVQIAKACDAANIQGFPTWIIKGKTYSGEQDFDGLAKASGFDLSKVK
ncbi:hypothetical protein R1sor_010898 [Riccia sorocarpa]|uniref:Vitamin K epoxide reductase domain-containing protein n=1 Tax=Riccia sorocarpa TaxID=122646 RepID=A0ABD3I315_9MARC